MGLFGQQQERKEKSLTSNINNNNLPNERNKLLLNPILMYLKTPFTWILISLEDNSLARNSNSLYMNNLRDINIGFS
jgi:hypothetical protein